MPGRFIPPVGSVSTVASRQNGRTVLERNTDDLAPEIGGQLQLVANRRGLKTMGRHLALLGVAANTFHRTVLATIDTGTVFKPCIGGYACEGGNGSAPDTTVTDGRHRRYIVDHRVLIAISLINETAKATLAKIIIIIVEIVPSHLVHH